MQKKQIKRLFLKNVEPIKLTESRRMKLHTEGWGLLTEYYMESVKINRQNSGAVTSTATLRVSDRAGQVTCIVKGHSVGLLFGLTTEEWEEIEELCNCGEQLFYRNFKEGLSKNFRCEQKMFYNFCMSNQKFDVLVAVFRRCVNVRNKDKSDALLQILELQKCDSRKLELYISHLHKHLDNNCKFNPD